MKNNLNKINYITDLIDEDLDINSMNLEQYKTKNELNSFFWNDDMLKPEIRKLLLENTIAFIKYAKLENLNYKDILLTGSLANYNYTDYSDFDVHILMDTSQISNNEEFVTEYLDTKKDLWKKKYDIEIKGHDVEMYVQDINEYLYSTGIYSLVKNDWVNKPINKMISIDVNGVYEKASYIMKKIDSLLSQENVSLDDIDILKNKIKKLRQSGLENNGEFSIENLAFKVLRNSGYLEKLKDLKDKTIEKNLSLENYNY